MDIGASGGSDEAPRSVRVEVGEVSPGAPVPDAIATSASDRPAALVLAAVLGVCVLIGALLFALAPDSGEAADGTPISPATTAGPTTTSAPTTTTRAPTTTTTRPPDPLLTLDVGPAAERSAAIFPLEAYDSAEVPGFFFRSTEFNGEHFALSFSEVGQSSLARSDDGLSWTEVSSLDDSGAVVGLGTVQDRLVIAVNDNQNFEFESTQQFEIRFLESTDGREWQPSDDFEPMTGRGASFFVVIDDEAVALPVRTFSDEPDLDALERFFENALTPARARQVCDVKYRTIGGTEVADLFDCDGNYVGELLDIDAPPLFRSPNYIRQCVNSLRTSERFSEELHLQQRMTTDQAARIDVLDQPFSGFGRLFGTTYLTFGFRGGMSGGSSFCRSSTNQLNSDEWSLFRATADEGSVAVDVPGSELSDFFGAAIVEAPDGDALFIGNQQGPSIGASVLRASPPFTEWEFAPLTDDDELQSALWSATNDASLLLAATDRRWLFLTLDGTIVRDVPIIEGEDVQLLLATNDYAIVQLDFERPRLIRVPLTDE